MPSVVQPFPFVLDSVAKLEEVFTDVGTNERRDRKELKTYLSL